MRAPKNYDSINTTEIQKIVKIAKDAFWNENFSKEEANQIIDEQNKKLRDISLEVFGNHGVIHRS